MLKKQGKRKLSFVREPGSGRGGVETWSPSTTLLLSGQQLWTAAVGDLEAQGSAAGEGSRFVRLVKPRGFLPRGSQLRTSRLVTPLCRFSTAASYEEHMRGKEHYRQGTCCPPVTLSAAHKANCVGELHHRPLSCDLDFDVYMCDNEPLVRHRARDW